jgi:hypothetical protein
VVSATCPYCRRQVTTRTEIAGVTIAPSFVTHGPSLTGSVFCEGSGKAAAK